MHRFACPVALVDRQTGRVRLFKSANAARRALGPALRAVGGRRGPRCRDADERHVLVERRTGAWVDLQPLWAQNRGQPRAPGAHRAGPVPGQGRRPLPRCKAASIRRKGLRGQLQERQGQGPDGEPGVRRRGEPLSHRHDDRAMRRAERSWKAHRRTQWRERPA